MVLKMFNFSPSFCDRWSIKLNSQLCVVFMYLGRPRQFPDSQGYNRRQFAVYV